jgi:hypothetical protein
MPRANPFEPGAYRYPLMLLGHRAPDGNRLTERFTTWYLASDDPAYWDMRIAFVQDPFDKLRKTYSDEVTRGRTIAYPAYISRFLMDEEPKMLRQDQGPLYEGVVPTHILKLDDLSSWFPEFESERLNQVEFGPVPQGTDFNHRRGAVNSKLAPDIAAYAAARTWLPGDSWLSL